VLANAVLGRSHRSPAGKSRLHKAIVESRRVLELPDDYRIAIVPASDTGAVEMALWSVLGARGVDVLAWESFSSGWVTDITKQLKLADVRVFEAAYGELPDLGKVDCDRDVVFVWNGTTSGVKIPDDDWIRDNRKGLTICDATSAAFAMPLPWRKLDIVTYSWQKVLGGEAAHGMLILSPRAVERVESYTPPWPLPKIFRLSKGGKLIEEIFEGATINTPSMLCVEDYLDALHWAREVGGLAGLLERSQMNLAVIEAWVDRSGWARFLARDPATRSNTSVCIEIDDPDINACDLAEQATFTKNISRLLEEEQVAYDINAYRDAPPGLRIWAGATVETSDIERLLAWLDWAYEETKAAFVERATQRSAGSG